MRPVVEKRIFELERKLEKGGMPHWKLSFIRSLLVLNEDILAALERPPQ